MLYVDSDGVAPYSHIAELRDVTLTIERDTIDASSHTSDGWKDNILGLAQWSASAEALYIHSDTAQDLLYTKILPTTSPNTLYMRFVPEGKLGTTSTHEKFEGLGIITSWELGGPNDDAAIISIEILGVGALTKGTLASGDNPSY
jgi:predicted secreted protein